MLQYPQLHCLCLTLHKLLHIPQYIPHYIPIFYMMYSPSITLSTRAKTGQSAKQASGALGKGTNPLAYPQWRHTIRQKLFKTMKKIDQPDCRKIDFEKCTNQSFFSLNIALIYSTDVICMLWYHDSFCQYQHQHQHRHAHFHARGNFRYLRYLHILFFVSGDGSFYLKHMPS